MSLIVVVLAVSLIVGTKWSRIVLTDEDRYLWAVSPLAVSPMLARLAGASVPIALRHRGKRRRTLPPSVARAVGTRTRWAMGTRAFSPSWALCHRMLHRHRRSHWRVTALMVLFATMGPIIRATSRVFGPAGAGTRRAARPVATPRSCNDEARRFYEHLGEFVQSPTDPLHLFVHMKHAEKLMPQD